MQKTDKDGNIKEEFCGICATIPIAMLGAGASAYGAGGSHDKNRKIVFWVGVATVIISTLLAIYFLFIKQCKDCKL